MQEKEIGWKYDKLKDVVLVSKQCVVSWLIEEKLIAKIRLCPMCDREMKFVECGDRRESEVDVLVV